MKSREVFAVLARKLHILPAGLDKVRLIDGTILPDYFREVLESVNLQVVKDSRNHGMVREFNPKSKHRWEYLNPEATVLDFARLLSIPTGRTNGELRATCLKPRVTKELLRQMLADQMEIPVSQLDMSMKVRDIKLPVAGNDSHSWVTFICWMRKYFNGRPYQLTTVADMSIDALFDFWLK